MMTKTISIAKDFSRYPGGRFIKQGPWSGELFREQVLMPAINSGNKPVVIELDGTLGYGSSFLEEAFGGLVRLKGVSAKTVLSTFEFITGDPSLIEEIISYVKDADKKK